MSNRCAATAFAVIASLVAAVATAPSGQAASSRPPEKDSFYAQPANIAEAVPGQILDVREITALAYVVPVPANAWQIKYRSADNTGNPTANVTTLMVPKTVWKGPGARPLVSHQVAQDGAGTQCAPSHGYRDGIVAGQAAGDSGIVLAPLSLGWAVVVPDYQGPDSQFAGGVAEARGVLDSLKAVRNFAPAGLQNSPIGLEGYSGGALASNWAAQLQSRYAPELPIKGVALGGVVADYRATMKQFNRFGLNAVIVMAAGAVSRAYPEENLSQYLNAKGKAVLKDLEYDCPVEAMGKYPIMSLDSLTTEPNLLDNPAVVSFLRRISPVGVADNPVAPVFMFHGTLDEASPIASARELFRKYCDAGVTVQKVEFPLAEHVTAIAGTHLAYKYLADRFAGKAAPSTC